MLPMHAQVPMTVCVAMWAPTLRCTVRWTGLEWTGLGGAWRPSGYGYGYNYPYRGRDPAKTGRALIM